MNKDELSKMRDRIAKERIETQKEIENLKEKYNLDSFVIVEVER